MTEIHTILHPTDFSGNSSSAFRLACSLARDFGARLVVLHVQPAPIALGGEIGPVREATAAVRDALWEQLTAVVPDDRGIPVEHRLRVGDEAAEIVDVAKEAGCDLIVMGTHGRTGLGRLLMGSVAEQVLRHASCPVLTVKSLVPGDVTAPATAAGIATP
jgi:nucleotide-binding universal stress UspA family protein